VTRHFTIRLPIGLPLLNANDRVHHRVRGNLTRDIRAAAMEACSEDPTMRAALVAAGDGPVMPRAYILGVFHPARRNRVDPANFYPSFKAAVDGLVDAGVLEDDDHTRVVGPDMRIGPVVKGGQISLHIQAVDAVTFAAFQWRTAS
jgi:crossover junction endodeoxyribonuclease RusA